MYYVIYVLLWLKRAHVIWYSFSFHFIQILKKTSQHFCNSGCKKNNILRQLIMILKLKLMN